MATVYVLVEHAQGELVPTTAELITAAKNLGEVTAVVVGTPGTAEPLREALAELGAAKVVAAEAEDADERIIMPHTDALSMLAAAQPGPIVIEGGAHGNEIAGRLAARLSSGVLCDVVDIHADRTASMSIFGDSIDVSAAVGGTCPIYTLRPGAIEAKPQAAAGELDTLALPAASEKDVKVTRFIPTERGDRPELSQAKVVVAGGRGVESAEGFSELVEPLADELGAAVGATRDAVDEGFYPAQYQIGQTGATVSPDLYIGLGISGAIQHTSGMQTAKKIVVINPDEDAPFFQLADLGAVGNAEEIVPALIEAIREQRS
ncbi:electron transfer flavoprotein subunit alpha/FixB family protein [Corynebacterium pelargi]|uniref:Electron transfer flavoprotein subunit alpha n=1 Tax=Corynebacterium pelargi TaxID=1471400 RepID=A0A410W9D4_9CORY|nr:electron transfer flavoprotein subunit alpha/FixB family protein [Corynebacterium pelargi]QAU52561.1 Electron transfer flavoprotein subunit alpha [Corynebacterium pelargi]GGG77311.1 electron transfer flavoprotein subunit alpha [Corynebacterium pelargi]